MILPYPDPWEQELKKENERIAKFKPKPKTYHEGANDERTAVIASLRRDFRKFFAEKNSEVSEYIDWKIKWLLQRNERYRKNPGGL